MKSNPLISVIVPVYNAEEYIEECLVSIVNQTYTNLEIIIVDDGSTDDSAEICDEFFHMDSRVNVIHQNNMGAATARKKGVLSAKGNFICFVDSDDKMDQGMVEFLVENIGECDLITSGVHAYEEGSKYMEEVDSIEEGIYATEKEREYLIINILAYKNRYDYGILPYLWNKMFKAEILKTLMMCINSSLSFGEDLEILFQYILKCKAICVTHRCFYYHRYRENSISCSKNNRYMWDLVKIYLVLEKVIANHPYSKKLMNQLQLYIVNHLYAVPWHMRFSDSAQLIRYVFPFSDMVKGTKIVLYGAGKVGMDYYRLIYRQKKYELVLWVDKNWEKCNDNFTPVYAPETIKNYKYDYIIVAVKERKLADEIKAGLIGQGLESEKVIWRAPAIL